MKKIIPILFAFLFVSLTDHAQPPPSHISGRTTVNIGDTAMLSGSPSGGSWSSADNAIAIIGTSGIVTGLASGTVNIWYYPPIASYYDATYVAFTVKDPTYVNIVANNAAVTDVYPNPASASLFISSLNKITTVVISNLFGQVLCSRAYDAPLVEVSIDDLPPGIYFVKINNSETRKFVKR